MSLADPAFRRKRARRVAQPKIIWICFDAHATDGNVWAIREGNQWHRAQHINSQVTLTTIYRGRSAPQPRAYLRGQGVVTLNGNIASITDPRYPHAPDPATVG